MKLFLLILSLIFLFAGCTGKNAEAEKPKSTKQATVSPPAAPESIGVFITNILDTESGRVTNLELCASVIDGCTVNAGEVFSFNDTVGRRTSEKGYERAKIIIDGERGYAVGGGICQISSTLLGAVSDAGLEVLERHNHDREVHYVEIGKDAAVSYGTQDFKFKNTLDTPITIYMSVKDGQVKAEIQTQRQ